MPGAAASECRDIVLVGGGHSHVGVLRRFAQKPLSNVRLHLVCRDTHTPYSGMLPGYVAGHYTYDDVHIDLPALAQRAGAYFYQSEVNGLERQAQQVLCDNRPPLHYDRVAINIGSTPQLSGRYADNEYALAVKPIQRFNARWLALLERVQAHAGPLHIAVVGGGAGGVELLLAMQYRLQNERKQYGHSPQSLRFSLFTRGNCLLPTHNQRVQRRFMRVLQSRGVAVHLNAPVSDVDKTGLIVENTQHHSADEVIWVTRARGAPWLENTGLALDTHGFIQVTDTLTSLSDTKVFAAGDVATMVNHPREKAGVFAVRQARPLAQNLRRSIANQPLIAYRPQRRWLALISTGDRYAVASRGRLYASAAWLWRWKDAIDRRFMHGTI